MNARLHLWAALDLLEGQAVRLVHGDPKTAWVVARDPVARAVAWQEAGVFGIHVVDLDAALGSGDNRELVRELCRTLAVPVQVGGGVRDEEAYWRLREVGARRVVVGSLAVRHPERVAALAAADPEALVVAADTRGGTVVVEGWRTASTWEVTDFARAVRDWGCRHLLVTAVARDGTGAGPDLELVRKVLGAFGPGVVASGGVGSVADLQALRQLAPAGLEGVVVGTALANGAVALEDALRVCGG